jgi:hypothetical protein
VVIDFAKYRIGQQVVLQNLSGDPSAPPLIDGLVDAGDGGG